NGRPVAGARLLVWTNALKAHGDMKPQAVTADDGRFRFRVEPADLNRQPKLVATGQGFAPDWADLGAKPKEQEVTLKLRPDDVPLTGRVLNLEGKPVEGVTAEVLWVGQHPQDKVADWIDHFVAQEAKG